MRSRSTLRGGVIATALFACMTLVAAGCGSGGDSSTDSDAGDTAASSSGDWPRTVEHEEGSVEIPEEPLRIVSTSITLTGTLLAIDAPVVASAATSVGPTTDDKGFFSQWADVADERGVEVLYPDLELDIEAVEAAEPDLIVGSTIGADSTLDAYSQLSDIAPTIMLDYGSNDWESLAEVLGEATGHESDAQDVISTFDDVVKSRSSEMTLPEQPVTAMTYNGAEGGGIFSAESAQASVLKDLGFEYVAAPEDLAAQVRSDVSFVTAENLPTALQDIQTLFIVSSDDAQPALDDPLLANVPAVAADRVVPLGLTSFRMDYYSASDMVDLLAEQYAS